MSGFVRKALIATLVLGLAATYALGAYRKSKMLSPDEIAEIPERLGRFPLETTNPTFRGKRDYLEDRIVKLSGADHYVAVDYKAEDGGAVRLHVGAAARTDAWFHEPTACLPVHGWTTTETVLVPFFPDLPDLGPGTRMWRMKLHKSGEELLVYYWFQYGDRIVTSRTERRRIRFQDLLAGRRDRPVQIVILYAPITPTEERTEQRIESLVRVLWPDLFHILKTGD